MPSLQVRELPEPIYEKLVEIAQKEHRSIAQQAIILLAKGLNISLTNKERRKQILESIEEDSHELKKYSLPDPTEFIREDRNR